MPYVFLHIGKQTEFPPFFIFIYGFHAADDNSRPFILRTPLFAHFKEEYL